MYFIHCVVDYSVMGFVRRLISIFLFEGKGKHNEKKYKLAKITHTKMLIALKADQWTMLTFQGHFEPLTFICQRRQQLGHLLVKWGCWPQRLGYWDSRGETFNWTQQVRFGIYTLKPPRSPMGMSLMVIINKAEAYLWCLTINTHLLNLFYKSARFRRSHSPLKVPSRNTHAITQMNVQAITSSLLHPFPQSPSAIKMQIQWPH